MAPDTYEHRLVSKLLDVVFKGVCAAALFNTVVGACFWKTVWISAHCRMYKRSQHLCHLCKRWSNAPYLRNHQSRPRGQVEFIKVSNPKPAVHKPCAHTKALSRIIPCKILIQTYARTSVCNCTLWNIIIQEAASYNIISRHLNRVYSWVPFWLF